MHGRGNMFVTFADKLLDSSREPRLPDAVRSNFRISPDRTRYFLLLLSIYRGHTTTLDPYCSVYYHLSTLGLSVPHRHETSIITTPIYGPLGAFFQVLIIYCLLRDVCYQADVDLRNFPQHYE
jgi:hypothetical protein